MSVWYMYDQTKELAAAPVAVQVHEDAAVVRVRSNSEIKEPRSSNDSSNSSDDNTTNNHNDKHNNDMNGSSSTITTTNNNNNHTNNYICVYIYIYVYICIHTYSKRTNHRGVWLRRGLRGRRHAVRGLPGGCVYIYIYIYIYTHYNHSCKNKVFLEAR